jgi:hypothetical protein
VRIGRDTDSEVFLTDLGVSRPHCVLEVSKEQVILKDLESKRGTFVNNERITQKQIFPADIIQVGATKLCLKGGISSEGTLDADEFKRLFSGALGQGRIDQPAGALGQRPAAPGGDGNIQVTCQCGQTLVARAKYAGTRLRCPSCDEFVTLPGKPARALSPPANSPEPEMGQETQRPLLWLAAYGVAGLLTLGLLGALASIFFSGRGR